MRTLIKSIACVSVAMLCYSMPAYATDIPILSILRNAALPDEPVSGESFSLAQKYTIKCTYKGPLFCHPQQYGYDPENCRVKGAEKLKSSPALYRAMPVKRVAVYQIDLVNREASEKYTRGLWAGDPDYYAKYNGAMSVKTRGSEIRLVDGDSYTTLNVETRDSTFIYPENRYYNMDYGTCSVSEGIRE